MHDENRNPALEAIETELNKAYIAGCMDSSGTMTAQVVRDEEYNQGYAVDVLIRFTSSDPRMIQKLDDFCARKGMRSIVSEKNGGDRYEFKIKTVRDVLRFIELIAPYFIHRDEQAQILAENIIPLIQKGDYLRDKNEFVKLVRNIDDLKEASPNSREQNYDEEYFRELWNV